MRTRSCRATESYVIPAAVVENDLSLHLAPKPHTEVPFSPAPDTKGSKNIEPPDRFGQAGATSSITSICAGSERLCRPVRAPQRKKEFHK